jgi:tetratricopeptide (TPR) repeat protein
MNFLNPEIQAKIYELEELAEEKLKQNDLPAMIECMTKAWELYPDPKTDWTEAYETAKHCFLLAKDLAKDLMLAGKWLDYMIEYNNIHHFFDGEVEFNIGMYKFDMGATEAAYAMFDKCVHHSGKNHFQYFEDGDKKYLEFYKKQWKIKNALKTEM